MAYQIGTSESRGIIGSRAARSDNFTEALEECCERSRSRFVKEAWLRPIGNGRIGDVIARFVKGVRQS